MPVAEAAAAEDDEDTEDRLAVVVVCAPVEEADVPGQVAAVGKETPALLSSEQVCTNVYVSLSEIPSYTLNSFLPSFIPSIIVLCVYLSFSIVRG